MSNRKQLFFWWRRDVYKENSNACVTLLFAKIFGSFDKVSSLNITARFDIIMEEEDEETTAGTVSKTSSTVTLTQHSVSRTSSATFVQEGIPQFQMVTHQASGDSLESEESTSQRASPSPKYSILSKSPHSSSSQEDYEPDSGGKQVTKQYLTAAGVRTETTKSMESLRATSRTFLSASERDMRRMVSSDSESKSLECLEREVKLKRHAVSGDGAFLMGGAVLSDEAISAEKRRGLWSGKARVPQHLSLPPPAGYLSLSPGDRKLTILSPHSPHKTPEMLHYSQQTLKTRRKKAMVLPRLVLPRSDSEASDVFSEQGL